MDFRIPRDQLALRRKDDRFIPSHLARPATHHAARNEHPMLPRQSREEHFILALRALPRHGEIH